MTLSESYYQTILTYSELISNSIHTSTSYYQIIVNTLDFEWTLEQTKISQAEYSQIKVRKVSMHTWNR